MIERSPIKRDVIASVDFMLVRENCGGAYYGEKIEQEDYACDAWEYGREEIERVARVAGALAMQHNPPLPVWSADKANVLANSRLWRRVVTALFERGGESGDNVLAIKT
jgi:3-isopropylmalate dehydrogenase